MRNKILPTWMTLAVVTSMMTAASVADAAYITYGQIICPSGNLCLYNYENYNGSAGQAAVLVLGANESDGNGYPLSLHGFQDKASSLVNNTGKCIRLLSPDVAAKVAPAGANYPDLDWMNNKADVAQTCPGSAASEEVASLNGLFGGVPLATTLDNFFVGTHFRAGEATGSLTAPSLWLTSEGSSPRFALIDDRPVPLAKAH